MCLQLRNRGGEQDEVSHRAHWKGERRASSSGRRGYLHPKEFICKDVPEYGEQKESDEREDDDPPGALLLQALLIAAQDE